MPHSTVYFHVCAWLRSPQASPPSCSPGSACQAYSQQPCPSPPWPTVRPTNSKERRVSTGETASKRLTNSRVSENSLCANSRCTRLGIVARTGTRGVGRERRYASPAAAILQLPFYRLLLLLLPLLCLLQQPLFLLFVGAHQLSATVPSVRVVNLHMNRTITRRGRECITIKTYG